MIADDVTLTEAEREAVCICPAHKPWKHMLACDRHLSAVNRILADRLAAVRADLARSRAAFCATSDRLATTIDRAESAERRLAEVEAATSCTGPNPRHYYGINATCQRCEMPSWVEAIFRAALANPPAEAGHPASPSCSERSCGQPALARHDALAVCDQEHGHEGNPARVYGHHGSPRTCIRLKATNEWVYDPAWETKS